MPKLLRLPQVECATGLKRSEIYSRIRSGEFPRQIRLGAKAVAWSELEIEEWIQAKIAARDRGSER